MNDEQWKIIKPLITDASAALLADVNAPITRHAEVAGMSMTEEGIVVFIGITSAQIRGGIGIALPFGVIRQTHPMRKSKELREHELRDWASEMANQLTGRIKGKLSGHGISFRMSSPLAVIGKDLRMPDDTLDPVVRVLEFTTLNIPFYVHFAARITSGARLLTTPVVNADDAREGDAIVF
jgi:CheY-specific phosphatase CheX